jgi:hypothetical protein
MKSNKWNSSSKRTPEESKPRNSESKSKKKKIRKLEMPSLLDKLRLPHKTSRSRRRTPESELKMRGEERKNRRPLIREIEKSEKRMQGLKNGIENNWKSVKRTSESEEKTKEDRENLMPLN